MVAFFICCQLYRAFSKNVVSIILLKIEAFAALIIED